MATYNSPFTATQLLRAPSPLLRNPTVAGTLAEVIHAQNRWSDPYAVEQAIGSIGKGYEEMNKAAGAAARTSGEVSMEEELQKGGYYPARAAERTGEARRGAMTAEDWLEKQKDMKQAFLQTKAEGLKPHTPEFSRRMAQLMTTLGGAESMGKLPSYGEARTQSQQQDLARQLVKKGLDQHVMQAAALDFYNTKGKDLRAANATEQEVQQAAWAEGRRVVQQLGLQPMQDPETGIWTARDTQGNTKELPPELTAEAENVAKAGGWGAMTAAQTAANTQAAQERAAVQVAAQAQARLQQAQAAEVRAQAAHQRLVERAAIVKGDQRLGRINDTLKRLNTMHAKALETGDTETAAKIAQDIAKEEREFDAHYERLGGPAAARQAPGLGAGILGGQQPSAMPPGPQYGPQYAPTAPGPEGAIPYMPGAAPRFRTGDLSGGYGTLPTGLVDINDLGPYSASSTPLPDFNQLLAEQAP